MRPREAAQLALLQSGELDYIWTYQNLAENAGLKYVKLPDVVDLGDPADSTSYKQVTTRVLGKRLGDTLTIRGAPILFGVSILSSARHGKQAEQFVSFLLSADGARILRTQHLDAFEHPVLMGSGAPPAVVQSSGITSTHRLTPE